MRLGFSLFALALSGAALASCGGDEVTADEYVGSICSALGGLQTTIIDGQTTIQESLTEDVTPEEGKEAISQFYSDATSAAEEASSEISDAGTPDVENGEEIADAIDTAFADVASTFEEGQGEVDALPTDSDQAFQDAAESFATTFEEDVSSIGTGLEEVGESPELEEAAAANSECESLQSSATSSLGATGATGP